MDKYSPPPHPAPLQSLARATQLYNNEKNATECNKMQQIYQ